MRSKLTVAVVGALLTACGAGLSPQLDVGESVMLDPDEGLLALVMTAHATNVGGAWVSAADFCDADAMSCFEAGPFENAQTLRVLELPAGRYCITRLATGLAHNAMGSVGQYAHGDLCTDVAAGVITYPGTLRITVSPTDSMMDRVSLAVRDDTEVVRSGLHRDHPNLLDHEVVLRRWSVGAD